MTTKRAFDESKVHRHDAGTPGGLGGQFAEQPGTAGWVAKASEVIDADLTARRRRYRPGEWVRGPDRDTRIARRAEEIYRKERHSKAVREAYTDEGLRELALKMATREADIQGDQLMFVNGPHEIHIATDRRVDTPGLMRVVDGLLTTNPPSSDPTGLGVHITVKKSSRMPDKSYGAVPRGSSIMWISDEVFDTVTSHGFRYGKMPAAMKASTLEYVVTHEWGHILDGTSPNDNEAEELLRIFGQVGVFFPGLRKQQPIHDADRESLAGAAHMHGEMSGYGNTNEHEAYAEAFAEWYITKGATPSKVVQAYARRFGWKAPA